LDQMQIRTYHRRGFRFVGRISKGSPPASVVPRSP
jgi:DNA-binding winged helix-turn-helix (wHTH) protein